jgi:hypothetical protein
MQGISWLSENLLASQEVHDFFYDLLDRASCIISNLNRDRNSEHNYNSAFLILYIYTTDLQDEPPISKNVEHYTYNIHNLPAFHFRVHTFIIKCLFAAVQRATE